MGSRPSYALALTFVLILAFDTATPAVTVALHDGTDTVGSWDSSGALGKSVRHAELLAPAIDTVIREGGARAGDLTHIAVGVGPGPFTGLRVGVTSGRTLGAALRVPVLGFCTLDILASASGLEEDFLVATDARRREVYWARYTWRSGHGAERLGDPAVSKPGEIPAAGVPVVGEGAKLYPDVLRDVREPAYPSAGVLAGMAASEIERRGSVLPPLPLYLRRPDARVPGPRKQVTPA